MESKKFPIKFPVSSSLCLGEPGGSRKFLGILLVYSSFGLLHFNESQDLEIDDAKPDYNYRAFGELSRLFTACLLRYFRFSIATFDAKEYLQDNQHNL